MITESIRVFASLPIVLLLIAALTFLIGRDINNCALDIDSMNCDIGGAEDLSAFFAP